MRKSDFIINSHSILARWRNHFSQLLNVHEVNEIRQTAIQTAEPLMPEPNVFEFQMANKKLNRHKLPGPDQIAADMIKAGGWTIILRLILLGIIRRNCLRSEKSQTLYIFIRRVIIQAHHSCQLSTKLYPTSCSQG
jgi:hypothetical protein